MPQALRENYYLFGRHGLIDNFFCFYFFGSWIGKKNLAAGTRYFSFLSHKFLCDRRSAKTAADNITTTNAQRPPTTNQPQLAPVTRRRGVVAVVRYGGRRGGVHGVVVRSGDKGEHSVVVVVGHGGTRGSTLETENGVDVSVHGGVVGYPARSLAGATALGDDDNPPSSPWKGEKGKQRPRASWPLSRAMKVVVRFALRRSPAAGAAHLGGISLVALSAAPAGTARRLPPPSAATPHAYTVGDTHVDHQGARSWLPTLDSASPRHRASHELAVKVTSTRGEGAVVEWGWGGLREQSQRVPPGAGERAGEGEDLWADEAGSSGVVAG